MGLTILRCSWTHSAFEFNNTVCGCTCRTCRPRTAFDSVAVNYNREAGIKMAQTTCKDTWQDGQIFFHRKVTIWLAQPLQFAPQSLSTALHQCLLSAQVGAFCFGLHMRPQPHKFLILHLTEIRIAKMIHALCTFNLSQLSHVWLCCIFPPSRAALLLEDPH